MEAMSPLSGMPAYRHQQSLSRCIPAKMSAFNSHMRQNAWYRNFKWTSEDLLPCYCYAKKSKSKTIRSQVEQPAPAGKGADTSELQAHHCMTPEQRTWLFCSVSVVLSYRLINCHCKK